MINYFITERFTSFFYEIINIEQWKLLYSNAGHLPPIAIRNSGEILHLPNERSINWIDPTATYQLSKVPLEIGDILLLYTNGIVEKRNELVKNSGNIV